MPRTVFSSLKFHHRRSCVSEPDCDCYVRACSAAGVDPADPGSDERVLEAFERYAQDGGLETSASAEHRQYLTRVIRHASAHATVSAAVAQRPLSSVDVSAFVPLHALPSAFETNAPSASRTTNRNEGANSIMNKSSNHSDAYALGAKIAREEREAMKLTREEKRIAARMGISPDALLKNKQRLLALAAEGE